MVGSVVVAKELGGVVVLEHAHGLMEPIEDGGSGLVGELAGQGDEGAVCSC